MSSILGSVEQQEDVQLIIIFISNVLKNSSGGSNPKAFKQSITCLTNVTCEKQLVNLNMNKGKFKNLLQDKLIFVNKRLELKPFQTVWITN